MMARRGIFPIGLARAYRLEKMAEVRKRGRWTFIVEMFRLLLGPLGSLDFGRDYFGVFIIGILLRLRPRLHDPAVILHHILRIEHESVADRQAAFRAQHLKPRLGLHLVVER